MSKIYEPSAKVRFKDNLYLVVLIFKTYQNREALLLLYAFENIFSTVKNIISLVAAIQKFISDKGRISLKPLLMFIKLLIRFIHPALSLCYYRLILSQCVCESFLKLTVIHVQRIDKLHFYILQLLPPLFELVLNLGLNIILSFLEHGIVPFIVRVHSKITALLLHSLIHFHQNLAFQLDLFCNIFFLPDIMTLMLSEQGTLGTNSLFILNADQLQWSTVLDTQRLNVLLDLNRWLQFLLRQLRFL